MTGLVERKHSAVLKKSGTDDTGARLAFPGRNLIRAPILLMAVVPLVAAALIAGLLPKPPSKAVTLTSEGDSFEYTVGEAAITPLNDGVTCSVSLPYTIQTPNPQIGEHLKQTFLEAGRKDVTTDSGDQVSFGTDGDPTVAGNTVNGRVAFWPRCKDVNVQPQQPALGDTSQKESTHVAMAAFGAQAATLPQWVRIAVSTFIDTAVFLGVTTVATIAVGLLEAPLVAAVGAVAAGLIIKGIAGCIGNAVAIATMNLTTGAGETWQEHLASAVTGCITGAMLGVGLGYYIEKIGAAVGRWLRALIGMSPSQLGGPTLAKVMEQAGLEMATPEQPLRLAAEAAARAAA
jgi:hypothetical protein